jgi:2-methylisocitrate lyase-like PEP mutase family enzyme
VATDSAAADRADRAPEPAREQAPSTAAQIAKAVLFGELHHEPDVLVLPNVWDVGGAVLLSQVDGVRALATTSAGIAAAAGFGDGERLGFGLLCDLVGRITGATALPVSVDLEAGYGRTADEVARSVASIVEAGAVGVNLEDGVPGDPSALLASGAHAARITAAREAADHLGVPIVINARTDVYWRRSGPPEHRFAETVRRLREYAAAGAGCVFAPGFPGSNVAEPDIAISELIRQLDGIPLNLLADTGLPSVGELRALGVRRLSVGSALYRLAMAGVRDAVRAMTDSGSLDLLQGAQRLPYPELAAMLDRAGLPSDSALTQTG